MSYEQKFFYFFENLAAEKNLPLRALLMAMPMLNQVMFKGTTSSTYDESTF